MVSRHFGKLFVGSAASVTFTIPWGGCRSGGTLRSRGDFGTSWLKTVVLFSECGHCLKLVSLSVNPLIQVVLRMASVGLMQITSAQPGKKTEKHSVSLK